MKRLLTALRGLPVLARDGQAGTLADLYFHDPLWVVRTVALERKDPHGRRLLIPAASLRHLPMDASAIELDLTLEEIAMLGRTRDLSVRSARSLLGYLVEARDGTAGRCEDILVDDACWSIAGFIVRSPLSLERRCLAPARAVAVIDSVNRALRLRFTRAQMTRLPAPAQAGFDLPVR